MHDQQQITETQSCPDATEAMIQESGYIDNGRLWRRWVMAQVFRNYYDQDGNFVFDQRFFKDRPYQYQWTVALNEIGAITRLSPDERNKRTRFFNFQVILSMLDDYLKQITHFLYTQQSQHIQRGTGEPYVKIPRCRHVFVNKKNGSRLALSEIPNYVKKTIEIVHIAEKHGSYRELKQALDRFCRNCFLNLPFSKAAAWRNAFRGAGAYYTMDNLIKFHNCRIRTSAGRPMSMNSTLSWLEEQTDRITGQPYGNHELFALMGAFIRDNGFDFQTAMANTHKQSDAAKL